MSQLPPEIINLIFSYMDGSTNRIMKEAINQHKEFIYQHSQYIHCNFEDLFFIRFRVEQQHKLLLEIENFNKSLFIELVIFLHYDRASRDFNNGKKFNTDITHRFKLHKEINRRTKNKIMRDIMEYCDCNTITNYRLFKNRYK
jgi:hypothetical protein